MFPRQWPRGSRAAAKQQMKNKILQTNIRVLVHSLNLIRHGDVFPSGL